MRASFLVVAATLAAACGDNIESEACEVAVRQLSLQAEDRYVELTLITAGR